ncbi:hypothetical protein GCM10010307_58430 [Streptomyces vastus]|uniref:Uncharacterized protein n=1 Tax=Streptomyces vastus TaxID=285451 RepID=A0ABP6DTK2_9ACTN
MSEGYEGYGRTAGKRLDGLSPSASPAGPGPERLSEHAGIPFLGRVIRVSAFLRDEPHAWHAAPDGWIRHA